VNVLTQVYIGEASLSQQLKQAIITELFSYAIIHKKPFLGTHPVEGIAGKKGYPQAELSS
jgi:hypothetical protein